jgi:catecholate siderophore receptor
MKKSALSGLRPGRGSRRKKGTSRLFVIGAAFMASTAVGAQTSTADAAPRVVSTGVRAGAAVTPSPRKSAKPASTVLSLRSALRATSVAKDDGPQGAAAQNQVATRFAIPAGPLSDVLAAFHTATGLKIVLALDSISTLQSPGVSGVFTAAQALQALLTGTGVSSQFDGPGSVVLELRGQNESVEVIGSLPGVQSPKYAVPLRDIAQSIALVEREVIEQQGAVTLSDVLRNVPGITLQAGEGGGASNTAGDMFNMRGFNASNSLFVDGVRDDGLISRDVFNLEQVEVFLGPTGSDVGRGTAAGYVNMQTKAPFLDSSQSVLLSVGSADQRRLAADFNIAVPSSTRDTWLSKSAARLNVLWQDSGVPGRDYADNETKAVAPSLALGLGTPTRVVVQGQVVRQNNLPDYGIPGGAWLDEPLAPTTLRAASEVDQTNYYGSPQFDYDDAEQNSVTARVEHDVNRRFTLRNQTRHNRTRREAVITAIQNVAAYNPATNLVTTLRQGNERENIITSNQTSIYGRFSTGRLRHAPAVGLDWTREEQAAPTLAGLGTRGPVDIFNPNVNEPVVGFAPAHTGATSDGQSTTVGMYAFDTVELNDRWQLSGGVRVERNETEFRSVDTAGVTTAALEGDGTLVSGKAGVLFRVAANGNMYFSYGSNLTPPGSANFTLSAQANNQNNPNVEPQESTNVEIGSKWDFAAGRVSVNGAVFRTENKNVIFTVDATAIPPLFNQDDGQLVNGFTLGAMGRVTDRWEVLANFGYLSTEQQSQNVANDGRRLTLTPQTSGSIWSTYRLPMNLTLGGGIRATDAVFINAANTIRMPGYALVDALVQYDVNASLSLRANVYNLTNAEYIRSVNNNGGRYNPGYTRAVLLTLHTKF